MGNDSEGFQRVDIRLSLEETTGQLFRVEEPVCTPPDNGGESHDATGLPTFVIIGLLHVSHSDGFVRASPDLSCFSVGSSDIRLECHFDSLTFFVCFWCISSYGFFNGLL